MSMAVLLVAVPERAMLATGSTQVLVVNFRVEVYSVGDAVGVGAVLEVQEENSYCSLVAVREASFIVMSDDALSVRKLASFV